MVLIGRSDANRDSVRQLAEALAPLLPTTRFSIGYYEPSHLFAIAKTIEAVIRQGAKRVLVVPAMLALEGTDLEAGIANTVGLIRSKFPMVPVEHAWPLDPNQVAGLLAAHIRQAAARPPQDVRSLVARFVDNQPVGGHRHG